MQLIVDIPFTDNVPVVLHPPAAIPSTVIVAVKTADTRVATKFSDTKDEDTETVTVQNDEVCINTGWPLALNCALKSKAFFRSGTASAIVSSISARVSTLPLISVMSTAPF